MAQFVSFESNVEVLGGVVLSIIDGMSEYKEIGIKILEDNGIKNIQSDGWYSLQSLLDAFKEISNKLGEPTLYLIGYRIPENAVFPPDIDTFEKGLALIDMAYHMNHRNGDIGYYKYIAVDENNAKVECKNPYPCEFDKGIIASMSKKYPPVNIGEDGVIIILDEDSENRKNGGDVSTYDVMW
ncbi:MAG: hypothetical protein A2X12_05185 [Bacteroidetes bacterium GWE2_29_8]|nr:MAG: hypothetical protein A2X12_05185 [Bacteroidetes bacterium GWE2_29_8]OFY15553.1 MAG: hypothetical protein A2X02_04180 [Bacteroidetes bacterium GWF2_29_10]